ncbi:hypothetical protein PG994_006479 [Apiospora phragmitis]|uniref:Serine hydrolase domain-containing protein n=1 Tax=Apiospora phragmitis TaxID=2905665 RepID=A0ABR1VF93_9PEZI
MSLSSEGSDRSISSCNRRILVVATAGGYPNAAPMLEIARILAERGYTIEFASFDGREEWIQNCPLVSRYHPLGPGLSVEEADALYLEVWNWSKAGWGAKFESRKTLESTWPQVYRGLSELVQDAESRPHLILSDYLVDASRDISFEHSIPLAMHWPQMPTAMLNAPYIPGTPGLQVGVLSSEYATLWQRFRSAFSIYFALPAFVRYSIWRENMRKKAGVSRSLPTLSKPDYLCLVNSMFGMEIPKDLPPNVAAVGPIISQQSRHLEEPYTSFLEKRSRVLYISFGTHLGLPWPIAQNLLLGALAALGSGTIDGVIWPMKSAARNHLHHDATIPVRHPQSKVVQMMTISELLNGAHPSLLFVDRAPQQALLQDDRVVAFLSHVGASSANEALYAGVPLITMAICFDQIQNELRLKEAGVSIALDKDAFTADEFETAIRDIVEDKLAHGPIAASVRRMMGIARICSRRKVLAADLIEEVIADAEGRKCEEMAKSRGVEGRTYYKGRKRHFHLQTADGFMHLLYDVIREDGPFDGILSFSQGAALAAPFLLHHREKHPYGPEPFQLAVFMGATLPFDPQSHARADQYNTVIYPQTGAVSVRDWKAEDVVETLHINDFIAPPAPGDVVLRRFHPEREDARITIPTVHIMGSRDPFYPQSLVLAQLCSGHVDIVDHQQGHLLPHNVSFTRQAVASMEQCMNKVIFRC